MTTDLAKHHAPLTRLFQRAITSAEWREYALTEDQINFFNRNGYLAGIRLLNDEQIETLRAELAGLTDPNHPGNNLFYEFHSNESRDPSKELFHALRAWRIAPAFHDLRSHSACVVPPLQLLLRPV